MAAHSFLSRDRAEAGNIVSRLSPENEALAREIIARYPRPKSAVIPLCHLVQEEHGHLTDDGMAHVAELVGVTAAQVQGTASFYEMFKRHETGRYVLGICTNISCLVLGGAELWPVPRSAWVSAQARPRPMAGSRWKTPNVWRRARMRRCVR